MVRPRNTTDEQILNEARACFLEHGAGASTTLIAARLGVSHAILFQRFGTKEKLMRAALMPPPEPPWIARVRSGPDDREIRCQLLELAQEIYTYLERLVPCIAVLRSAGLHVENVAERPEDIPPVRARRETAAWFARAATPLTSDPYAAASVIERGCASSARGVDAGEPTLFAVFAEGDASWWFIV